MTRYWATHPDFPNKADGRARGRVLHLAADPTKTRGRRFTLCGMLIVEKASEYSSRATCLNCREREGR